MSQSRGATKLGRGLFTKSCNHPPKGTLRPGVGTANPFASAESDDSPICESSAKQAKNAPVHRYETDSQRFALQIKKVVPGMSCFAGVTEIFLRMKRGGRPR